MPSATRERAIKLRRKGLSYLEICKHVPVSKSTLSIWLRSVELTNEQKQRLTEVSRQAGIAGAEKRRQNRRGLQQRIYKSASEAVGPVSPRELWLMGSVLYWAEGAKEKEYRPGSGGRVHKLRSCSGASISTMDSRVMRCPKRTGSCLQYFSTRPAGIP